MYLNRHTWVSFRLYWSLPTDLNATSLYLWLSLVILCTKKINVSEGKDSHIDWEKYACAYIRAHIFIHTVNSYKFWHTHIHRQANKHTAMTAGLGINRLIPLFPMDGYSKLHQIVRLQFWISEECGISPSLISLPGPLCLEGVVSLRVRSMGQIDMFKIIYIRKNTWSHITVNHLYSYLPTPPLRQDTTPGQFLSGV